MTRGIKICKVAGTQEIKSEDTDHVWAMWWMVGGYHAMICKYCEVLMYECNNEWPDHVIDKDNPGICLTDEEKIIKDLLE